jgi:hypothetical protein
MVFETKAPEDCLTTDTSSDLKFLIYIYTPLGIHLPGYSAATDLRSFLGTLLHKHR